MMIFDKKELKDRHFYLFDNIEAYTIKDIIEVIHNVNIYDDKKEHHKKKNFNKYTRKPIKLFINSFGGGIYSGLGLYSVIKSSKTPVHTYLIGAGMSAAFIIYLAGKKRFAYPYSYFMLHQLSSIATGKLKDIEDEAFHFNIIQSKLDEIILKETLITKDQLCKNKELRKDWYIDIQEAKKLKIVHKEIKNV